LECEVWYRTCDNCHKWKIVYTRYPRLALAYGDRLGCAKDSRVWVYLCSECLQALREEKMSMRVQHKYDCYPSRDALDSTTHIPSPLMGEDKGEGDNWGGRSWAAGLPETCHCEGFFLCPCEALSLCHCEAR
jgi:hypothetical protein